MYSEAYPIPSYIMRHLPVIPLKCKPFLSFASGILGGGIGGIAPSTFGGNVFGTKMNPQADSKEFNEFV